VNAHIAKKRGVNSPRSAAIEAREYSRSLRAASCSFGTLTIFSKALMSDLSTQRLTSRSATSARCRFESKNALQACRFATASWASAACLPELRRLLCKAIADRVQEQKFLAAAPKAL
jgi:hypothetical protein